MTQVIKKLKPLSVNTQTSKTKLTETESPFLRGYEISMSKDGELNEGGNFGVGKKMSSNFRTITIDLPKSGTNKTIGFFESKELNEAYVLNYNSAGNHGIYYLDGNALTSQAIAIRPGFNFSTDPQYSIPPHRCFLKIIYGTDANGNKVIIEKHFIFTDSNGWQRWVNVIAALATNGFNTSYFALQPPHYDADELIDFASRPPMYAPVVTPVQPTAADQGLQNTLFQKSTQFTYRFIYTDGRATTLAWFSIPYFTQPITCDANNINEPRCLDLTLYAGSPHVEKIQLLIRNNGIGDLEGDNVDTDWALYDTIYKYSTDGVNEPGLINNQYWKRTNSWADYKYDPVTNTIVYRYCGDKGLSDFSVNDALMVQNDVPLKSVALTPAGDVIIWSDNLRFYPNLPQSTIENIAMDVVQQASGDTCNSQTVKITLYATFDSGCFSCKNGNGDPTRYFGRMRINTTSSKMTLDIAGDSTPYNLNFNTYDGFLCYLAGTSYYSIGKQYRVGSGGAKTEIDVIDITDNEEMASVMALYLSGGYIMQQFDFEVPAGHYIARLARHGAAPTSDYEQQSTYLLGIAKNNQIANYPAAHRGQKEILIDASAGDVDLWDTTRDIFYVFCPFYPGEKGRETFFLRPFTHNQSNSGDSWRIIEGYLKDNVDDTGTIDATTTVGIELVNYYAQLGLNSSKIGGVSTDHNGFFFVETLDDDRARSSEVFFDAQFKCGGFHAGAFRTQINTDKKSGYYPGQNINISDLSQGLGNFIAIKGNITSCVSGNGISNVGITMTQGKTYFTDSQGNYEIRAHTLNNGARVEDIYINGNGNCLFSNCDCSTLKPIHFDAHGIPCENNSLPVYNEAPLKLKVVTISGISLKGGGSYPVGIIVSDLAGRKTAASLIGYQYVPTFLERGNFNPTQIRLTLTGALKLPSWAKWVNFIMGKNANSDKYIQWVGDKIEFIDARGNIVDDGNGAIRARITIQSLLDFNISENFATTATYQFVKGDRLRIYDDGQGNLFDPATNNGYLDYQVLGSDFNQTVDPTVSVATTVNGGNTSTTTTENTYDPKSFIIDYDERLLALKDLCGFWIELYRNIPQTDNEPLFGVSGTYPVINGEIMKVGSTIILDAFDTYYQKRNIIIANCSGANLNHPFESQSITDYWGDNVTSAGMVLFRDPQAEQRWYTNDSIKSDAFDNQGRVNGLGTCRTENRKNFNDQDWGGILATHAERNIILFICENDWFTTDYSQNYARVDSSGRILANPANGLGDPYQKTGDNYGCGFSDVSTIMFDDGMAYWLDQQHSAFVMCNYSHATDLAMIDNKGYFVEKIKFLQRNNNSVNNDLSKIIETCAGINPMNGNIYISFRPRYNLAPTPINFINNEREVFYNMAETFIYNPSMKKWVGWAPFVPEYYGSMGQAKSGQEFLTFANGEAWFHNSKTIKGSMNFYGVDTDQVINVVSNFDESKLKVYQSIAIERAKIKYFISKILTDDPGLYSMLSLSNFKRKGNVLYSTILRNMNTYPDPSRPVVSMLQDGKSINGNYCEMQLVSDPNNSQEYIEIDNILVRFIGSEKSEK